MGRGYEAGVRFVWCGFRLVGREGGLVCGRGEVGRVAAADECAGRECHGLNTACEWRVEICYRGARLYRGYQTRCLIDGVGDGRGGDAEGLDLFFFLVVVGDVQCGWIG